MTSDIITTRDSCEGGGGGNGNSFSTPEGTQVWLAYEWEERRGHRMRGGRGRQSVTETAVPMMMTAVLVAMAVSMMMLD